MSAKNVEIVTASGTESFIPLSKLKKSPKNARKTPHWMGMARPPGVTETNRDAYAVAAE